MSTPTDRIADEAIAKLEAEDAGLDPDEDKGAGKDDKGTDNAGAGGAATGKDGKPAGDDDASGGTGDGKPKEGEGEEEEFTADDAEEIEEEVPASSKPATPTDNAGIRLSTDEQKYIVENIGDPIVIRGYTEDADGNPVEKEIKAYSWENVPADFKFSSEADRGATQAAFDRLERRASDLLGNYRQDQSQSAAADFERRENESISADVAELQKEGRMPKFKVRPGTKGFDEDPAAVIMAEVLQIMNERNQHFLELSQQGRAYKHIGYAEAYDIYERTSEKAKAARQRDDDQEKEDKERKAAAERGASNRGGERPNIQKPTVKPGTTTRDLQAMIDNLD